MHVAILCSYQDPKSTLWRIPLVNVVRNDNNNTVIVSKPPTEFLPTRPPPSDAIHNIYELKTHLELVRYYHVAAGFPTKPTWLRAIKNKHFTSCPGLTVEAVTHHFPDSEETSKGHGRKDAPLYLYLLSKATPSNAPFVKNKQFSPPPTTSLTRQLSKSTPIRPGDFPKSQAAAINISLSSPILTAMQFLLSQ